MLVVFHVPLSGIFFLSILAIALKLITLLALSLFFSSLFSSGVTAFLLIATYIIGHSGFALLEYGILAHNVFLESIAKGILTFFPNLEALNTKSMVHLLTPPPL